MNTIKIQNNLAKRELETFLQDVLDTLKADDGKSFEEKRTAILDMLKDTEETLLADIFADLASDEIRGEQINASFWHAGREILAAGNIVLREVIEDDRESFGELKRAYSPVDPVFQHEAFFNMLWSEHTQPKALMLSIIQNGEYAGYCGIQDLSARVWEISIELKPHKVRQGIGYAAVSAMLDALKSRLGASVYKVRIDPANLASQRLFEKLGAKPNGISEYLLHDREVIEQCENDSVHMLDDALIAVAEKFDVPPRKLLSHVLEYKLIW